MVHICVTRPHSLSHWNFHGFVRPKPHICINFSRFYKSIQSINVKMSYNTFNKPKHCFQLCDELLLDHSRVINQTNVDLSYLIFWLRIEGPMDHRTIWTISLVALICTFRSMGPRNEDQYVVQHLVSALSKQLIMVPRTNEAYIQSVGQVGGQTNGE